MTGAAGDIDERPGTSYENYRQTSAPMDDPRRTETNQALFKAKYLLGDCCNLVATHLLLFWSLYREQTVTTVDAATHVSFGLPFSFLYQNQTWEFGSEIGHMKIGFSAGSTHLLSPLEHPTHMIWPHYFLDLALVWGSLLLITLLILWVIRKVRRA